MKLVKVVEKLKQISKNTRFIRRTANEFSFMGPAEEIRKLVRAVGGELKFQGNHPDLIHATMFDGRLRIVEGKPRFYIDRFRTKKNIHWVSLIRKS